ncbi:MAG: prepilin-type N-terminal cleavage/methylation domain-containing protein [Candidatus Saccharimonadales bacterium]
MNLKRNNKTNSGFTIIELMIAMAFIALLLLAIATTVMQVGAIYSKGVTMKSVNQAGRLIVSDMKRTIGEVSPFDVADAYKPHDFNEGSGTVVDYDGGRLCTGVYSYIWNIGKHIQPDISSPPINQYDGSDSSKPIRLIRVLDSGGQRCKDEATDRIKLSSATEMLSEGNLAVQDFRIERLTDNLATGVAVYIINMTISDATQDSIKTVDNSCKPPSEGSSYQNYCAVNEFVFTVVAGNKGGQ